MKLLKVIASGFKNCADDFEVSLVPVARKNAEDKEYELVEIAEGLYAFSTIGVVGKNASGKTSVLELLRVAYDIIGPLRVSHVDFDLNNVRLCIFFYYEGYIYKYTLRLENSALSESILFKDQVILRKRYYKSKINEIFDEADFEPYGKDNDLPEDTSKVYFVTKQLRSVAMHYNSFDIGSGAYGFAFNSLKVSGLSTEILMKIIRIFDENVSALEMIDENSFKLVFCGKEEYLSERELYYRLSSGTSKGVALYTIVVISLLNGFDLIIDEIENHFHKTLVENIISLYKDKTINKKNATLIFSTHYCEILDLFNRQDNIYITKSDDKLRIFNMYSHFDVRSELLKSKQFYNNVFKTAVNYDALMDLKKVLK